MVGRRESHAFHTGSDASGRRLSATEREQMLRPYLPAEPEKDKSTVRSSSTSSDTPNGATTRHLRLHHRQRVRPAVRHIIHSLLFSLIHTVFSIYIRFRQAYHAVIDRVLAVLYYHHRTPELIRKDVKSLTKLPQHLSVILELPPEGGKKDRLETLVNEACEIAAWSACAGIPVLSVYERTGILKSSLPHLHRRISRTLTDYFGASSPSKPTLSLRAPNQPSYSPPHSPDPRSTPASPGDDTTHAHPPHLTILLLDASDGRQTLVDLTKTLADMSQQHKLVPSDISSELIDAEITESVMGEPDLIIGFGERVLLQGYPPWQARLTEIYHSVDNASGVGYSVFLRGLYGYGKAKFNLGR